MIGMNAERLAVYRQGLHDAATAGREVLEADGSALDAAVAAVVSMENSGVFNAGLGAVLTADGQALLDAGVMTSEEGDFGSVGSVPQVANPIVLARRVMENTPHALLVGEGARQFAQAENLALREDYPTPQQLSVWKTKRTHAQHSGELDANGLAAAGANMPGVQGPALGEGDTVGAVVIDAGGQLAAAVSTGGIWLKMPGRVGDAPLPGAGLWVDRTLGAAVSTGTGELILRALICKEVVDKMALGPVQAGQVGVDKMAARFGPGCAGVIAISADGEVGYAMNTNGMGRAIWREGDAEIEVAVWREGDP